MRELLTRKFGPAPVWLWFVVFVIGAVIFLRYRSGKTPTKLSSDASTSPNLTTGPSQLLPFSMQTFVNTQQNASHTPPAGRHSPQPPTTEATYKYVGVKAGQNVEAFINSVGAGVPGLYQTITKLNDYINGVHVGGLGPNTTGEGAAATFTNDATYMVPVVGPPRRRTSMTTPTRVVPTPAGSGESSSDAALASMYGYQGSQRLWSTNPLLSPQ